MQNEPGYELRVPKNKGREAMVYLTYIIDHFDALPNVTVFLHAADNQDHNELVDPAHSIISPRFANHAVLGRLNFEIVARNGYTNLRCDPNPGCPLSISPLNPSQLDIDTNDYRAYFDDVYTTIFATPRDRIPERIAHTCCAQFAVTRERILQRPRTDYERMRNWIIGTHMDSHGVGWVFEMVWHIIFGCEAIQ